MTLSQFDIITGGGNCWSVPREVCLSSGRSKPWFPFWRTSWNNWKVLNLIDFNSLISFHTGRAKKVWRYNSIFDRSFSWNFKFVFFLNRSTWWQLATPIFQKRSNSKMKKKHHNLDFSSPIDGYNILLSANKNFSKIDSKWPKEYAKIWACAPFLHHWITCSLQFIGQYIVY